MGFLFIAAILYIPLAVIFGLANKIIPSNSLLCSGKTMPPVPTALPTEPISTPSRSAG